MTYCFKCPICGEKGEYNRREPPPRCFGEAIGGHDVAMRRDYQAENALIDKFSLRQDVRGTRAHRADPLPPDEAHRVNQERMS